MLYVTVAATPVYQQMTLEEFLFGQYEKKLVRPNVGNTRTFEVKRISNALRNVVECEELVEVLRQFNAKHEQLFNAERATLYRTFYIPKRSGGFRRIDAPEEPLMLALYDLKYILEEHFKCLYHTSAHAYMKKRSTITAIQRHVQNKSKWYGKLDISNFFGSTSLQFVMKQLGMIFPFCEVVKVDGGYAELEKALSLAFLDGVLPQGTPVSPLITNVMMIPIDYKISQALRRTGKNFVYTRYADDFCISSKESYDIREISSLVSGVLSSFGAPFALNDSKTRYGSTAGRNWNLGIMVNSNGMSVGRNKIKHFENSIYRYIRDKKSGIAWSVEDVQILRGYYAYYRQIDKDTIDRIVAHYNSKNNVDVIKMMTEDMK